FEGGVEDWTKGGILLAITFLSPFLYDALHKSGLGKDPKVFGAVAFVLVALVATAMGIWGGFRYPGGHIPIAARFRPPMAFNVWYRIWPGQQKIINAVKAGTPPDPAVVSLAGARSRHNVYMSVPLLWAMINQHTTTVPTAVGIPARCAFTLLLVVILLGW